MAWEDYIPNIFGAGMPQYLPGLLGEQEAAELQNRAKVQGLLGAGLALAQGMSSAGPRRSAAQNILSALAGGVSAGQGAYQGATQNYMMQQKIAESMLEREKAQNQIASQKEFFARYPHLRGIYGASPAEAAKVAGEEEAWRQIDEAYKGGDTPQVAPQTQVAAQTQIPQDGTQQIAPSETPNVELGTKENPRLLGAVPVETSGIPPEVSNLLNQKQYLLGVNKRLTGKRGGSAEIDKNLKIIEGLDKQLGAYTAQSFDFQTFKGMLPEQFRPMVDNLESLAYSGAINPKDLNSEIAKISNAANEFQQKQKDFAIEANRLAFKQFKKPLNELSPEEVGWVDAEIQRKNLEGKKAGAASQTTNVYTGELSKGTKSKVEEEILTTGNAIARLNQIRSSYRPEYQNIQFRTKQAFSTLKDKFGALPTSDRAILQSYATYRQNSVNNLNQTIKDLTGAAMGVQEAERITAGSPNAGTGLFDGDSPAEFEAKLMNQDKQVRYALARKQYALRNGLKWENISLDNMPQIVNKRGDEIAKQFNLDPKKPADLNTIQRQLAAEFGIAF